MTTAMFFGFAGDILTFIRAAILAVEALFREQEFREHRKWTEAVKSLPGVKLKHRSTGVSLTDENDVPLVFIRQNAGKALWGACFLALGFASLFASRYLELTSGPGNHG